MALRFVQTRHFENVNLYRFDRAAWRRKGKAAAGAAGYLVPGRRSQRLEGGGRSLLGLGRPSFATRRLFSQTSFRPYGVVRSHSSARLASQLNRQSEAETGTGWFAEWLKTVIFDLLKTRKKGPSSIAVALKV